MSVGWSASTAKFVVPNLSVHLLRHMQPVITLHDDIIRPFRPGVFCWLLVAHTVQKICFLLLWNYNLNTFICRGIAKQHFISLNTHDGSTGTIFFIFLEWLSNSFDLNSSVSLGISTFCESQHTGQVNCPYCFFKCSKWECYLSAVFPLRASFWEDTPLHQ